MQEITYKQKMDFLSDIIAVYKKHGLVISHEDFHGAFLVEHYLGEDDPTVKWLLQIVEYGAGT